MEQIQICVNNMVDMVRRRTMNELTSLQRRNRRIPQRTADAFSTCVSDPVELIDGHI